MKHDSSHPAAPESGRTSGDAAPNAPSAAASDSLGTTTIPMRTFGRLIDRIAELEADAARYRWLRDVGNASWRPFAIRAGYSAAKADAAIDAAMAAASSGKESANG